mgnify:CR=1 FL=1
MHAFTVLLGCYEMYVWQFGQKEEEPYWAEKGRRWINCGIRMARRRLDRWEKHLLKIGISYHRIINNYQGIILW